MLSPLVGSLTICTRLKSSGRFTKSPLCLGKLDHKTVYKKVQVGKDQEKVQSKKDSHSKNRSGKKPNQQSGTDTKKTFRKPNEQLFSHKTVYKTLTSLKVISKGFNFVKLK